MKSNHRIFIVSVLIFSMIISSCVRNRYVLDKKTMMNLTYDIYVAEALIENDYNNFGDNHSKEILINSVFKKYNVTTEQWDSSLSWYSDHMDRYLTINDSVKARIERERNLVNKTIRFETETREKAEQKITVSSYIPKTFLFSELKSIPGFRFRMDSLTINEKISDSLFNFSFRVIGLPSDTLRRLKGTLVMEYSDTTIYRSLPVTKNIRYRFSGSKFIPNDTLKYLSGFVNTTDTLGLYNQVMIYDISLTSISPDKLVNDSILDKSTLKKDSSDLDSIRKDLNITEIEGVESGDTTKNTDKEGETSE